MGRLTHRMWTRRPPPPSLDVETSSRSLRLAAHLTRHTTPVPTLGPGAGGG